MLLPHSYFLVLRCEFGWLGVGDESGWTEMEENMLAFLGFDFCNVRPKKELLTGKSKSCTNSKIDEATPITCKLRVQIRS